MGCAIVATLKNADIEVIYMNYNDGMDKLVVINREDSVLMADFSLTRDTLEELSAYLDERLQVFDHHATAQEALEGLDFCTFDMTKCGAVLLWEALFPDEELPILLQYIQDRDLWTWQLENSQAVSSALKMIDNTDVANFMPYLHDVSELVVEGNTILAYENHNIAKIVRNKDRLTRATIEGHKVICINSTTLISELGNALVEDELFVAMYFIKDGDEAIFSLRADNKCDVSKIAKVFGGGGHPNASGFSVPLEDLHFILNN